MDAPQWGYAPEYEFEAQRKSPYIFGEFVWTGFDYLGEPTPYKTEWPSRSSYFGIVDLCGLPKNRFYAYQAEWSNKEVLHIFPHWNWNDGQEVPVHCYTNFKAVELFVNGKSYGRKEKSDDNIHTKYRIIWDNVKYEAGEIKAVAYDNNDKIVKTEIIKTADVSASISLKPDRSTINADGDDLCYITVGIYDKNGNICHKANNRVFVSVEGAAELIAVDNGDQTSLESFQADNVKAFNGLCMLTVRSTKNEGLIKITVTSEGLPETKIQIKSK
jgi:beta-galactosidase